MKGNLQVIDGQGPVSQRSREMFSHPESRRKIAKPYDHRAVVFTNILNMNIGSLHTRSFRRIHLSACRYRCLKLVLRARKVSGAFEKRAPGMNMGVGNGMFWLKLGQDFEGLAAHPH